ncbi:hypothetical protein [Paenibacillus sp. FSL R7-0331]|uniref:hypothetical protein n=1 Tax=Paenibacillus sp. FSL R7-0331 TaxID=1536773 RepID=UPI0004F88BF2|nr:hypothetical protein [Paenibacillus sp. FSL R7-0331]AIQ54584.1 hypothetical protein R70331_25805 [Paenibacillus sp. FSL R7-0331]
MDKIDKHMADLLSHFKEFNITHIDLNNETHVLGIRMIVANAYSDAWKSAAELQINKGEI